LTHLRARALLGAYLDEALDPRRTDLVRSHLAACRRCRAEVEQLRRLRTLLRADAGAPAPPDWTGFWAGVARAIEAERGARVPIAVPRRPLLSPPRLAFGGALVVAAVAAVTLWQVLSAPPIPEGLVVVRSARTEVPGGALMVYAPPEQDLAVVWVFQAE
jgi:anti-sigma factor RsiW